MERQGGRCYTVHALIRHCKCGRFANSRPIAINHKQHITAILLVLQKCKILGCGVKIVKDFKTQIDKILMATNVVSFTAMEQLLGKRKAWKEEYCTI